MENWKGQTGAIIVVAAIGIILIGLLAVLIINPKSPIYSNTTYYSSQQIPAQQQVDINQLLSQFFSTTTTTSTTTTSSTLLGETTTTTTTTIPPSCSLSACDVCTSSGSATCLAVGCYWDPQTSLCRTPAAGCGYGNCGACTTYSACIAVYQCSWNAFATPPCVSQFEATSTTTTTTQPTTTTTTTTSTTTTTVPPTTTTTTTLPQNAPNLIITINSFTNNGRTAQMTVSNVGTQASGVFKNRLTYSNGAVCITPIGPGGMILDAGQYANAQCGVSSSSLPCGITYTATATADYNSAVAESNENDNSYSTSVFVSC